MAIGTLLAAGIGAGASLFGGLFGSSQARKAAAAQERALKQAKAEEQNWYDRNYNQDPTKLASAQRVLAMTRDAMRSANRRAAGRAAVMGSTEESEAATKAANAQVMADTASSIAANADARRDTMDAQHLKAKQGYDVALAENEYANRMAKAQATATAVQGVGQAVGALGAAIDEPTTATPAEVAEGVATQVPTGKDGGYEPHNNNNYYSNYWA